MTFGSRYLLDTLDDYSKSFSEVVLSRDSCHNHIWCRAGTMLPYINIRELHPDPFKADRQVHNIIIQLSSMGAL